MVHPIIVGVSSEHDILHSGAPGGLPLEKIGCGSACPRPFKVFTFDKKQMSDLEWQIKLD